VAETIQGSFIAGFYQQDTQNLYLSDAKNGEISIFAKNESPYKESSVKIETESPVVSFI